MFRFDGFELDPDRYRLNLKNEAVTVEPRVLELITYLVRNRDRVVTKDELYAALWSGQILSDAALSRCVYQARRILGDDSRHPRFIETIRGRGYRFAAAVHPIPADEAATRREAHALESGDSASGEVIERPGLRWRSWAGAALVLAAVIVLGSAVAERWSRGGVPRASASRPDRPSVLVTQPFRLALLPFEAAGDDPQSALVALSVTELLRLRLEAVPGLMLRAPNRAAPAGTGGLGTESVDLARVASELGVSSILRGTLETGSDPERRRLEVVLHTADRARGLLTTPIGIYEVPRLDEAADLGHFTRVREAIVGRVVDRLLPAVELPDRAIYAPADPEAYRLYLLAHRRQSRSSCEPGIITLLDRSLERDAQNPLAWELLAIIHWSEVWACGGDASRLDDALAAAARASAVAPERVDPRLLQAAIWIETGRVELAYEAILDTVAQHPHHPGARYQQVYALRYAGYLDLAEGVLEEVLALDPLHYALDPSGETPNLFLYQNRLDEFLGFLPDSDTPYHGYYRGLALVLLGDLAAAREVLDASFRSNPADIFGRFAQALMAILDGDHEAGRSIVLQIARQRRDLGGRDGEITYKEAQLLALAGDLENAAAQLELAVAQGFFCAPYLRIDPALEGLRDTPSFARILQAATERHRAFGARFGIDPQPPLG